MLGLEEVAFVIPQPNDFSIPMIRVYHLNRVKISPEGRLIYSQPSDSTEFRCELIYSSMFHVESLSLDWH